MILKLEPGFIPFGRYVQNFCRNQYKGYANGCPNYNKKEGCPPCELINEILDFEKIIYLVYTEFLVSEFGERMRARHPSWTDKQCFNSRLWQQKARKEHNLELEEFRKKYNLEIVKQPERKGVDVNLLFAKLNMKLEWPPRKVARIVSLAGEKKQHKFQGYL